MSTIPTLTIRDEYGVKYTSDGKILIKVPKDLQEYTIKPGTEIICSEAFFQCERLASLEIPESVKEIGDGAFYGCRNLKSITLSSPVIHIGIWAFKDCSNLKDVNFRYQTNVKRKIQIEIDETAFKGCPIESLTIPLCGQMDLEEDVTNKTQTNRINDYGDDLPF